MLKFELGLPVQGHTQRMACRGPLAGLLCLTLALACGAAQSQALRLGAIVTMARESDAQLAAARAAADAAQERLQQAEAAQRPNVNLSVTQRRARDGSSAFPNTVGYDAGSAALTLTQPLFRLANKAATEQAEFQAEQLQQQLRLAEQDLLLRAARSYFETLQAQDELAAAVAQKTALVQQLNQTRRSLEVGTVPITDLNEAQARHDLAVAQEIAAQNELESRLRVLEKLVSRPIPGLARLGDGLEQALPDAAAQQRLVEAAPRDALQVAITRNALWAGERELARREAGHTPTLDLVGTVRRDRGVNANPFGTSDTRQSSIGFELNLPLYQGGAVASRMREAVADLQRLRAEVANAERQAQLDAYQAQLGVRSGEALTRALRQALSSSETQLRSTQRGLQAGVRTRVDVLNAEQQLFVTRKDLAAARYRTLLSGLQLRAAAGVLNVLDLQRLDTFLVD